MSQTVTKPLSMTPEAIRQREHREKVKQVEALESELSILRASHEAFKAAVAEFTKLKEGLEAERQAIETERQSFQSKVEVRQTQAPATLESHDVVLNELYQRILADVDLVYYIQHMYFKSQTQRNQL